jgi:hypothetical protein
MAKVGRVQTLHSRKGEEPSAPFLGLLEACDVGSRALGPCKRSQNHIVGLVRHEPSQYGEVRAVGGGGTVPGNTRVQGIRSVLSGCQGNETGVMQ